MSAEPAEPAKLRWRLDISYDGTNFAGWAAQAGRRTVQGELEGWITRVLRLDEPAHLVCAGRTDAGVHARGQVAHLDLDPTVITDGGEALTVRLNKVLGADCVIRRISAAPPGFDARFAAIWRRYVYRLSDAGVLPDPLYRYQIAQVRSEVDLARLNEEAATLLGLRDFGAFCRRRDGASTIRTLLELTGRRIPSGPIAGVIECTVRADAFCHSMVRSLVGALVAVATGQRDHEWLAVITERGIRDSTITVMPAAGLTLEEVGYPADHELAMRALEARAMREASRS
ncbi:MAG TPA: tRNA pseudouridine(38-40) synthase TruA [Propionibacteriaceae bacterium]|nr:tRNA pseudouridine(38-40) synthase TruA [Propionibacteriaceae bacterium]